MPVESTEYAFRVSRMRHAPPPVSFPILRPARQMLIPRFSLPAALAHNFADLAAVWAGAEPLVKPGSRIRFKPFVATETFAETMLELHLAMSIARQSRETRNIFSGDFKTFHHPQPPAVRVPGVLKHQLKTEVPEMVAAGYCGRCGKSRTNQSH